MQTFETSRELMEAARRCVLDRRSVLQQIKDRNYILRFEGKLGERPKYTGRILGAGISYDRKTKEHFCRVEVLRRKITDAGSGD